MLDQINTLIAREEKFLPKFAPGTSQHSLLKNRITALRTVCDLITEDRIPTRVELDFALPRIESLLHKTRAARDKYAPDSANFKRFTPAVKLMESAKALILHAQNDSDRFTN